MREKRERRGPCYRQAAYSVLPVFSVSTLAFFFFFYQDTDIFYCVSIGQCFAGCFIPLSREFVFVCDFILLCTFILV